LISQGKLTREGMLIRGEDGALYWIKYEQMQPFRLSEDKQEEAKKILDDEKYIIMGSLGPSIMKEKLDLSTSNTTTTSFVDLSAYSIVRQPQ
jgi:hypothetical protein